MTNTLLILLPLALLSATALAVDTQPASQPASHTVPNIPALAWGKSGETTFCGSLAAALKPTDPKLDYPTLMGYSALAFRTRWFQGTVPGGQKFCPSSPVGEFPEETQLIIKSTGYPTVHHWDIEAKDKSFSRFFPEVLAELNANRPVISYDATFDCNLIVGYETDAAGTITFLTHNYRDKESPAKTPADKIHVLMLMGNRKPTLSRLDAITTALHAAVKNWSRNGKAEFSGQGKGFYALGSDAYDRWTADIASVDAVPPAPDSEKKELFHPSWWTFDCLTDARRSAATFLRAAAPDLPEPPREHLLKAADLYDQLVKTTAVTFTEKSAFLGPWSGKKFEDWTPETRQREIALLKSAQALDQKAIDHLAAALTILDAK